jgi:hypothetical protein
MSQPKLGNPAVVGLAGFGLTTLLLQFHNLGWASTGPVLWTGLVFGGLAQLLAGLQEQKTGNDFGYGAFTSYGAFWLALCGIFLGNHFGLFKTSGTDLGWFLLAWTGYTAILWFGALHIHGAMAFTFTTLLAGFVLLVLGHFGPPVFNTVAAVVLIVCALGAWYMMAGIVWASALGRPVLPMGRPWRSSAVARPSQASAPALGALGDAAE